MEQAVGGCGNLRGAQLWNVRRVRREVKAGERGRGQSQLGGRGKIPPQVPGKQMPGVEEGTWSWCGPAPRR